MNINPKKVIYYERYLWDVFIVFSTFLFLYLFIQGFIVSSGTVFGRSMEDTYFTNEKFIVNKIRLLMRKPERYDVVQFVDKRDKHLVIKRVIGLPGETVVIKRGKVFLKNEAGEDIELDEPYLTVEKRYTIMNRAQNSPEEIILKSNEYYLLGDNRPGSLDSRYYGPIPRSYIVGYVE